MFKLFDPALQRLQLKIQRPQRLSMAAKATHHWLRPLVEFGEHTGLKLLKPVVNPLLILWCQHKFGSILPPILRLNNSVAVAKRPAHTLP